MTRKEIVWEVPESLYQELVSTQQKLAFPQLGDLTAQAVQRYLAETQRQLWQQEFYELQRQVRQASGFQLGTTKDEIISNLCEQRRQIFETEYAHLY
jgi:hypothetical protein